MAYYDVLLDLLEIIAIAPNRAIAEFANTVDPDETAHNGPSHLNLQCLPCESLIFQYNAVYIEIFLDRLQT